MPQRLSPLEARRTVAVFCLLTAINGFQFQNYAAKIKVAETTFHASEADINWLYSSTFIVVCVFLVPIMCATEAAPYPTAAFGAVCCTLTSVGRLVAVHRRSYALTLASGVTLGLQAAVIVTSFVQLVHALFPRAERSRFTQLCIQANYVGWGLGTLVGPYVVTDRRGLTRVLEVQAVVSLLALVAFATLYRLPSSEGGGDADGASPSDATSTDTARAIDSAAAAAAAAGESGVVQSPLPAAAAALPALPPSSPPPSSSPSTSASFGGGTRSPAYMPIATSTPSKDLAVASSSSSSSSSVSSSPRRAGSFSLHSPGFSDEPSPPPPLLSTVSFWANLKEFLGEMYRLLGDTFFLRHCLCLSIYTGIGYSIPGIQNEIFEGNLGLSGKLSGWASFIFIFSGVASGLYLGSVIDSGDAAGSGSNGGGGEGFAPLEEENDDDGDEQTAAPDRTGGAAESGEAAASEEEGVGGSAITTGAAEAHPSGPGSSSSNSSSSGSSGSSSGGGGGGSGSGSGGGVISREEEAARRLLPGLSYLCTASICGLLLVQVLGPKLAGNSGGGGSSGVRIRSRRLLLGVGSGDGNSSSGGGGADDDEADDDNDDNYDDADDDNDTDESFATTITAGGLVLLMVPAGAASLGVLGVGLSVVVGATARPPLRVSETYSSSLVEGGTQLATSLIVQCSSSATGYLACAVAGLLAALITAAAGCASNAGSGRASSGGASAISSAGSHNSHSHSHSHSRRYDLSSSPPHHTSSRRAAGEGSEF
jgi:hypothetical protein